MFLVSAFPDSSLDARPLLAREALSAKDVGDVVAYVIPRR